jgi:DNA-binding NarL/FixJ family response regulator
MIRILLVDDQNLVQQGIKSLLAQDPDLEIVGTLKDGRSAVSKVAELSPDIVLLDIEMPGMDGVTATKYITSLAPQTKVIILSSHEDEKYLTQALMAGAKAYLLKDSLVRDLRQSIIAVNNGYTQMESKLLAKIFHPSNLKSNNRQKTNHQEQRPRRSPNPTVKTTAQSSIQATVVQQSPVQQTTSSRKQSMMFADSVKDKKMAPYQAMLAQVWTSQSLRHQPLINRCQAQMAQYKYQLSPLLKQLKQWQKKNWLIYAGLALLGLITVIIVSQIFS